VEVGPLEKPVNRNICEALRLSEELLALSAQGEEQAMDDGCRILFGIVRDCAHKIRSSAERERETHSYTGHWERGAVS
jgi:hypothetical protein